jgi:hypothetical protein
VRNDEIKAEEFSESIEQRLLDLHLNRLDIGQVAEVEEAIGNSRQLAAASQGIRRVMALLDEWEVPPPATDLADRIIAKVYNHTQVIPFPKPLTADRVSNAPDLSAGPMLSLRELIAIAACITLFVGIFVPGYFKAQHIARRNLCRENLRQVWSGVASYAEENRGYISHAGFVPNASWLATRVPKVQRVSNTQSLFNVLRSGHINDARVFICPSTPHGRPMLADDYKEFNDFAEPANISYSFQYMNVPQARRLEEMDTMMALIADRNPFFDGRAAHRLSPYDEEAGNSLSHEEGAGQNVMYIGGRGGWFNHPTVGVNQDNIYRAGARVLYQGTEQPTSSTDSFLVN